MPVLSQRVQLMKKNFMELHNQGYSIPEISDKFHLSPCTVYSHLQEIADENRVARKSLLKVPHKPHGHREGSISISSAKDYDVDLQTMETLLEEINNKIKSILEQIDNELKGEQQ